MPPMQKITLYTFLASIMAAAVLLALLPVLGPLPVLLLTFAVFGAIILVATYLSKAKPGQPVVEDERDKAIMRKVPTYVAVGLVLTVAGWILVLAFLYANEGQVPVDIFGHLASSFLGAQAVFTFAGVMIGYWRAKSGFVFTPKWKAGVLIAGTVLIAIGCLIAMMLAPDAKSKIKPRFTSMYVETSVGTPVQFIDTSMGDPIAWEWEFGDGATSREQNPTHVYISPGRYTVQMTAYDKDRGVRETKEDYMTVLPAAAP